MNMDTYDEKDKHEWKKVFEWIRMEMNEIGLKKIVNWLSNEPNTRHWDLDQLWKCLHKMIEWTRMAQSPISKQTRQWKCNIVAWPKNNGWTTKNGNDHMKWLDGMTRLEMDQIQPMKSQMNQCQTTLNKAWISQRTKHKWMVVPHMKLGLEVSIIRDSPN